MSYIKAYGLFSILYLLLTFVGVFINSILKITPEVSLNIVALIVTTFMIIKFNYINFFESKLQLTFSLLGGGVTVIAAYTLASVFNSFSYPTMSEGVVLFIFNSIVIYLTIQVVLKKNITKP